MFIFKLFYRLFFTLYAFVGVFYFKWSIFPIVFLFWVENIIQSLFLLLISLSTLHISLPNTESSRYQLLYGKFFVNGIYFVFLTFGWGFISLITGKGNEESFDVLASIFRVLTGRDTGFNIAVLLCFLREGWRYLQNFVVKKEYTAEHPFLFPSVFGHRELVLHLSLIFGMGGSVALSQWLTQDDSPTFLSNYGFIVLFLVLKLIAEVFVFYKDKPKAEASRAE